MPAPPVSSLQEDTIDLYALLGVARDAAEADIKKAFRSKAKTEHPDKGGDAARFRAYQKAYNVLSDPVSREHYNKTGRLGRTAEEDFLDFYSSASKGTVGETKTLDLTERLVRPTQDSHSAGFEEWLRSRNTKNDFVNDDTLCDARGVTRVCFDVVTHSCKHAVQRAVRRTKEELGESSVRDVPLGRLVKVIPQKLKPELHWGEVLVSIKFANVCAHDAVFVRVGEDLLNIEDDDSANALFGGENKPAPDPEALGTEFVGEVLTVGPGIKELRVGDWVLPLRGCRGGWRTASIWRERELMKFPADVIPVEYAALARELFLAYYLLQHFAAELKPGDGIVLNAANSTVGQTIVQLSKLLGFRCYPIVRRHSLANFERLRDYLLELGAAKVFAEGDIIGRALERDNVALPKLALDAVAGEAASAKLANTLAQGGRLVVYGGLAGRQFTLPWTVFVSRGMRVESFYLPGWLESASNREQMVVALSRISKLVETRKLVVNVQNFKFSSQGLAHALQMLAEGGRLQRPILQMPLIEEEASLLAQQESELRKNRQASQDAQKSLFRIQTCLACDTKACLRCLEVTASESSGREKFLLGWIHNSGELPEEFEALVKRMLARDPMSLSGCGVMRVSIPEGPFVCSNGNAENQEADAMSVASDEEDLPMWTNKGSLKSLWATPPPSSKSRTQRDASLAPDELSISEIKFLELVEGSVVRLGETLSHQAAACGAQRIVLSGFEDGAILAMMAAASMNTEIPIVGVIAVGMPRPCLPLMSLLKLRLSERLAAHPLKVTLLNGSGDTVTPPSQALLMQRELESLPSTSGVLVKSEVVPHGTHNMGAEEMGHMVALLSLI